MIPPLADDDSNGDGLLLERNVSPKMPRVESDCSNPLDRVYPEVMLDANEDGRTSVCTAPTNRPPAVVVPVQ